MKIALIGATGFVGKAILKEALDRGHEVTAIARDPSKIASHGRLHLQACNVMEVESAAKAVQGHEAVISAFNPGWRQSDLYEQQVKGTRSIIEGVKRSSVKRLLFVGGAGSLEVKPGIQLVDGPQFPAEYKQGALATREALALLRQEAGLEWTFLSPSADLFPGTRTGRYRIGRDQLLKNEEGQSRISVEDYAKAMVDEVERPAHVRQRFTVGY
ncbi:hypothetical protein W02_23910 [Nitrospira sp. KM1]|uniref:NAD(P)-dependent oxidoreductase n=1 Tax=Nitrospira sp. KM1 TaxID=1936990 RepID=UPI0013A75A3C|nr:hypothetical protein W02_23910 [Nitrospira sp. KM1]